MRYARHTGRLLAFCTRLVFGSEISDIYINLINGAPACSQNDGSDASAVRVLQAPFELFRSVGTAPMPSPHAGIAPIERNRVKLHAGGPSTVSAVCGRCKIVIMISARGQPERPGRHHVNGAMACALQGSWKLNSTQ
jgi:hypothetical protein